MYLLAINKIQDRELYQLWRKRNRVRLIDISKYCGCTPSALSQWENNLINISDELVSKYNRFIQEFENRSLKQ